jgi:branched-chain amino acid transport system ATP-binding protein
MGKTTLVRAICGLHRAQRGEVVFRGVRIEAEPAHRIARRGLGLVPEGRQIFANLTVLEHLSAFERERAGPHEAGASGTSSPRSGSAAERIARVFELFPRLRERRTNLGNQLSGGEQQMLAIGRALVTNPTLLIMDEPSEGLAPTIIELLIDTFRTLEEEGLRILLIEQNLGVATSIADRQLVMVGGEIATETTATVLAGDPELQRRYLGVEPIRK